MDEGGGANARSGADRRPEIEMRRASSSMAVCTLIADTFRRAPQSGVQVSNQADCRAPAGAREVCLLGRVRVYLLGRLAN